jgi:UDP-2,4-diacetamido-2,4,6-trideoxy-beta-L-altropyranose hydrolase
MKKKLIFRADGNSETGLGHLYRLFALVEMYKDNFEFVFITKASSTLEIIPTEYTTLLIPVEILIEKEPKWLAKQFNSKEHLIIADGYHFDSNYQKKIKDLGFFLMYVDDLTTEYMYADVVVNHSSNITEQDYSFEKYTRFALGTDYAILRPLFLKASLESRKIDKIDTVFVCFGGADKYDLSLKVAKALIQFETIKKIHIVIGGAYQHQGIYNLEKEHTKIHLHKNLSEEKLYNLMKNCNFGIAPSSTILYELCAVKMPILSGYFVDNQQLIYKGFLANNAIFGGGDFMTYNVARFQTKISEILEKNDYQEQYENQKKLISNKIKKNFVNLLKNQL